MIVHLNGRPGIGKLTIGRVLAQSMRARLLDSHSVCNVAFALTIFQSEDFYSALRGVRSIAFDAARKIPLDVPIILTDAHFLDQAWAVDNWTAIRSLAADRGSSLFAVTLECAPDENKRRIMGESRLGKRKPRDEARVEAYTTRSLFYGEADFAHTVEVTDLAPEGAARQISNWINAQGRMVRRLRCPPPAYPS